MATPASNRKLSAPVVDPTNKPYWDAAAEGKLLLGKCAETGRFFHYPRGVSPFTLSDDVSFSPASGEGVIYSFSIMRTKEPYCLAYVTLAEGPTMFTNIVDCDLDTLRIGDRVRLVFKPTDGGAPLPVFTPA